MTDITRELFKLFSPTSESVADSIAGFTTGLALARHNPEYAMGMLQVIEQSYGKAVYPPETLDEIIRNIPISIHDE